MKSIKKKRSPNTPILSNVECDEDGVPLVDFEEFAKKQQFLYQPVTTYM